MNSENNRRLQSLGTLLHCRQGCACKLTLLLADCVSLRRLAVQLSIRLGGGVCMCTPRATVRLPFHVCSCLCGAKEALFAFAPMAPSGCNRHQVLPRQSVVVCCFAILYPAAGHSRRHKRLCFSRGGSAQPQPQLHCSSCTAFRPFVSTGAEANSPADPSLAVPSFKHSPGLRKHVIQAVLGG